MKNIDLDVIELKAHDGSTFQTYATIARDACLGVSGDTLQSIEASMQFYDAMVGFEVAWKNIEMARKITKAKVAKQHPNLF